MAGSPSSRRAWLAGVGVAAAAAGVYWYGRGAAPGDAAADGDAIDLWSQRFERPEGGELVMATLRGKPLFINFWATWCPPCRKEIPAFSAMSGKYRDKGVQFVGISIDTAGNVRDFQREHQVGYPLLIAEPSVVQLTESLGNAAQGLPFTVIVDKTGVISRVKVGMLSEDDLDTTLGRLTRP